MAVSQTPQPRKLTPGGPNIDPIPTNPATLNSAASPSSVPVPGSTPSPGAIGISQLPDGVGGAVTVPPPTMAPGSATFNNGVYSVDGKAQPLPPSNGALPFDQSAAGAAYDPHSETANGKLDWGLPGSGLGVAADPTGAAQKAAGYIPFDPTTGGPVATDANSPLYLSGRLPLATGQFVDGHSATPATHPDAQVVPYGQPNAGSSMAGQPLARPLTPSDATASIPTSAPTMAPSAAPADTQPWQTGAPTLAPAGTPPSTFTADQNLINAQINPTPSARLLGAQGQTDASLSKVLDGPDRVALASGAYDDFATRANRNFNRARTDATNDAAAHGQIGSGQLTNRYGDLEETLQENDALARSGLIRDAVTGTIGDRLNNYGAARNAENAAYGEDVGGRNELRGERGYQQSLAEQAIQRRIQQQQAEQGATQQDFQNGATLYGIGNASDPTGAYQNAAANASNEAASSSGDVGALIQAWLRSRQPQVSY
jgi:hypothetical protein